MKRFLLFAGEDYYPQGGALDLIGGFDSIQDAKAGAPKSLLEGPLTFVHIYDCETERIVLRWASQWQCWMTT